MKVTGFIAIFLTVAGCSGSISGFGNDLPVVQMSNRTGDVAPPARKYLSLPVRSFRAGADGEWEEFPGADCSVTSGLYRANLTTPAQLVLPDLGPDADPVTAVCSAGMLTGRDSVAPDYSWPAGEKADPVSRVIYGGGWWYGYDKSGPMKYGDLSVGMR